MLACGYTESHMKKDLALIALGVWIAAIPFLGFPGAWKTAIFVLSGLAVVFLTILWRHELLHSHRAIATEKSNGVYVENGFVSQETRSRHLNVTGEEAHEHEHSKNSP